jgi:hypothetical protein
MASLTTKSDTTAVSNLVETMDDVSSLQQSLLSAETRMKHVGKASKAVADAHRLLDDKVDSMYRLMMQWNISEPSSGQKSPPFHTIPPRTPPIFHQQPPPPPQFHTSPPPPPQFTQSPPPPPHPPKPFHS